MKVKYYWTADKDLNRKVIFTLMNITWAVVKIRLDKNSALFGIWTHDLCNTGAEVTERIGNFDMLNNRLETCETSNHSSQSFTFSSLFNFFNH